MMKIKGVKLLKRIEWKIKRFWGSESFCPWCGWPCIKKEDCYEDSVFWHPEAFSMCTNPNCNKQMRF